MLPFEIQLRNGPPVYEQLLYAVRKAVWSGRLEAGEPFPSVRVISRELKVNPNTVQKAIGILKKDGYLEVQPGVGTVVTCPEFVDPREKAAFMEQRIEELVIRARELGVSRDEVINAVNEQWERLTS